MILDSSLRKFDDKAWGDSAQKNDFSQKKKFKLELVWSHIGKYFYVQIMRDVLEYINEFKSFSKNFSFEMFYAQTPFFGYRWPNLPHDHIDSKMDCS